MKITLSTHQIASELYEDKNAGWSYAGARALAEWLEGLEDETGEEMELDVVAIRCDFSEYGTAVEAAEEYGWKPSDEDLGEDEMEEEALEWLAQKTAVIEFNGGIIIQQW